jgi:flagellin-like hook-associated protein FlgL
MVEIAKSMFPVKTSYALIAGMKARYDKLQTQLATGERAANLAEMGSARFFDLTMRSRLSRIEGYADTMKTVNLRLEVLDTSMTRLNDIEAEQRTSITPGSYGTGNINFTTVPQIAQARFDEALTLLDAHIGGRYLFAGGKTDQKPIAPPAVAINGEAGKAGFKQVVGERKLADLGASGQGRVGVTTVPASSTSNNTEDGDHPFGFKLSTLSSSSANIALTQPGSTQPRSASVQFTATLPIEGDAVTLAVTLSDGTSDAITLTATTEDPPPTGKFLIGTDAADTAAKFDTALNAALTTKAGTTLAAASAYAAAGNFFNAQGEQVMRVDGPPFESATQLVAGTAANTVFWYVGEDATDARSSVNAKVDDGTNVNYGVQANESGIVGLVRTLAANAVMVYSNSDSTSTGRFDAMASRQIDRLAESNNNNAGAISSITVELGLARTTMNHVGEWQDTHSAQLQTMLAGIENIPSEEVAMEILALKTRLEASFETTSLVAQLSLVNYLR